MTVTPPLTPKQRRRAEQENRLFDRFLGREIIARKVAAFRADKARQVSAACAEAGLDEAATAEAVARTRREPVLFPVPSKVGREEFLKGAEERAKKAGTATAAPIASDPLRGLMGRAGLPVPPRA